MEDGPFEEKELKPKHFTGTMRLDELWHGRKVWVHAWWTVSEALVPCEIVVVHLKVDPGNSPRGISNDFTVRPLTGNTHARQIDIRNIVY